MMVMITDSSYDASTQIAIANLHANQIIDISGNDNRD